MREQQVTLPGTTEVQGPKPLISAKVIERIRVKRYTADGSGDARQTESKASTTGRKANASVTGI